MPQVFLIAFCGIPQGSIVEPVLFYVHFNDFFDFIEKVSFNNFTDDDSLNLFAESVAVLVKRLELETKVAL